MTTYRECKNFKRTFGLAFEARCALIILAIYGLHCASIPAFAQDEQDPSAVFGDQSDDGFGGSDPIEGIGDVDVNGDDDGPVEAENGQPFGPAGVAPVIQPDVQELPEVRPIPDSQNGDHADDASQDAVESELIRELYPNGNLKIRRQVTQDKDENFINHGTWEMWDENENQIIRGSYRFGKRHGKWMRRVLPGDAKFLSAAPYAGFGAEYFTSIATFSDGKLDGKWTIEDDRGNVASEWNFALGRRDGKSTWYYFTRNPMRVINYHGGELNGELLEYDGDQNVVTSVEYLNGRRLEKTTKHFAENSEQKQIEGMTLRARLVLKEADEWWKMELARYTREGKDEKHGKWTAWYPNGEKRMEGEFQYDQPSGPFTWWHKNGQKSLEAMYSAGKKEGVWTWWHENGLRSIRGSYVNGSPASRWTWWHETGKVSHRVDYTPGGGPATNVSSQGGTISQSGESVLLRSPLKTDPILID